MYSIGLMKYEMCCIYRIGQKISNQEKGNFKKFPIFLYF